MDKVKEKSNINYTCKARTIFATAAKSDVVKVEGKIWVGTNLNIFVQEMTYVIWGKQFEKYKRLLSPYGICGAYERVIAVKRKITHSPTMMLAIGMSSQYLL